MMYKRPIFTPFGGEFQRIATSGDPVNPIIDDGSEEETPEGEEEVVKHPSGTLNALHYGKLLASGEAGYFDIANQGYQIERVNSNDEVTKPYGEGIDHHYPNPPNVPSTQNGSANEYWGLPSGLKNSSREESYSYFQSGIFTNHNDDAKHLTGSGLRFFTNRHLEDADEKKISGLKDYTQSIFNRNFHKSAFSNNISTLFEDFWTTDDNITYTPVNGYGVAVKVNTFSKTILIATFDSSVDTEAQVTAVFEDPPPVFNYEFHKLVPPAQFGEVSTVNPGRGATEGEALLNSISKLLGDYFGEFVTNENRFEEERRTIDTETQTILITKETTTKTTETMASGVIGKIKVTSNNVLEEGPDAGIFEASISAEVYELTSDPMVSIKSLGTDDLIMHHRGTGVLGEEQSAVVIPYLGDYKIVKEETGIEQVDSSEIKCEEIKTNVEKTFEGE